MRTTLSIDDDLLAAAKVLARERSETVGRTLSDLARKGLYASPHVKKKASGSGFPVFPTSPNSRTVTLEDVQRDEDEA